MKGLAAAVLVLFLAGCGASSSSSAPTPTPAPPATAVPATSQPTAQPSPTVVIPKAYAAFLRTICGAFSSRNAQVIVNSLPYYQYNSGLRYGMLGDGEGQTGDPSLMHSWLASGPVRCLRFTPAVAGHGTLMTGGWHLPGAHYALLDLDTFNGRWKINDFTFGGHAALFYAMHTSSPILRYAG